MNYFFEHMCNFSKKQITLRSVSLSVSGTEMSPCKNTQCRFFYSCSSFLGVISDNMKKEETHHEIITDFN